MNILVKLHRVFNRLIIGGIVVLSATALYLLFIKEAPPLEKNQSFAQLQEDFLQAVRSYDIKSAKRYYGYLQAKNPYSPFVEELAPAYMADVYLHYANQLAFNPEAADMFKAEARRLAPNHPVFIQIANAPLVEITVQDKTTDLSQQVAQTEVLAEQELDAYLAELASLAQTFESMEAAQVQEEAAHLETLLSEATATPPPAASAVVIEQPRLPETPTDDACLLSYYTRSTPVSTCTDVLSSHHYGPSLFVVGDEVHTPLAFTQQPITLDAFNTLCVETKGCEQVRMNTTASAEGGVTLDLSDVESTVNHYNAFCDVTQSCDTLSSGAPRALLNPKKLPEYASLLSKQTGYTYRPMTNADIEAITAYFKACVAKELCEESLSEDISRFLINEKGVLLVRKMNG